MQILECPEAAKDAESGDQFEIKIKNITQNKTYKAQGFPDFLQQIINAGGLMPYVQKRLSAKA